MTFSFLPKHSHLPGQCTELIWGQVSSWPLKLHFPGTGHHKEWVSAKWPTVSHCWWEHGWYLQKWHSVLTAPMCALLQVPAELHSSPQLNPLLPGVSPDLYPAWERGGCTPEQLLHHKPHGCAAANARQQWRGLFHLGDGHCCGCRKASFVPKPRWECKWGRQKAARGTWWLWPWESFGYIPQRFFIKAN